ncbi:MAG: methyltransferase [Thermoplasmatales archaeon]|nr:methyltransferase [Candidatus Thermoplasmatota archaeon]MDA8056067.1 methyltransferase [Thermoplasmatales archaeon]
MSDDEVQLRLKWHNSGYKRMEDQKTIRRQYLGRKFVIPKEVFPPPWMSKLLGKSVLEEVKVTDRVLDMGTGCGVNAILAASRSADVLGVDINPFAVENGKQNSKRNGVAGRIRFVQSDLFQNVEGKFDLIIFDPPFRWFSPRDLREMAVSDENFKTMSAFFEQVRGYLNPAGRILIFYGDSGDMNFFRALIEKNRLKSELVRSRSIEKEGRMWGYYVWKLTPVDS